MTAPFDDAQQSLQRKPVYRAVFEPGTGSPLAPLTLATQRVRIRPDVIDESDTVSDTFSINEFKTYDLDESFPFIDRSPVGDLFHGSSSWEVSDARSIMRLPAWATPMQIFPEEGHCSVGSVRLTAEDVDDDVASLIAHDIRGQTVQIYAGFHDLDIDDYLPVYKGIVESVELTESLTGFHISVHNPQTLVNKQLFQVVSFENARAITDATLSMTFTLDVDQYDSLGAIGDTGYVLIDSEVIKYRKALFFEFNILERAAFGSIQSDHAVGAPVHEIIPIGPAHPIDIILGIYHGTPSKTCLGVGYHNIDWAAFAAARAVIGTGYQMQFFITEEANAMEWLRAEIFRPTGCYPFVTGDGKLSIKAFKIADPPVVTFDHGSIQMRNGKPDLGWGLGTSNLGQPINDVTINYDLNPVTGEYHSFYREIRSPSIATYGRFPIVINSAGLRFGISGTAQFIVDRVGAILDRFENGAPVLSIRTHLQKQSADVGEIAGITSRFIPNRSTGTRGVTNAKAEIINRSIQWDDGLCEFTLLGHDTQL